MLYRPLYRPLIFEPGRLYYHARRFVQYNDAEFWAYKRDLEFVGAFVEERIDRVRDTRRRAIRRVHRLVRTYKKEKKSKKKK